MRFFAAFTMLLATGCEAVTLDPYVDPAKVRLPIVIEGPGFEVWEGEEVELVAETFTGEGDVEDGVLVLVEDDALPLEAGDSVSFVLFVDVNDDDGCAGELALRFETELRRVGDFYRASIHMDEGVPTDMCTTGAGD